MGTTLFHRICNHDRDHVAWQRRRDFFGLKAAIFKRG